MSIAWLALTETGAANAAAARAALGGELHLRAGRVEQVQADVAFEEIVSDLRALFAEGRPIVGFCAAGILIRALAPLLADKHDEPPVIAVSEDGSSIVPLLGGHRGANDLARKIGEVLGGTAAITTAGDTRFGIALDAPPESWVLANPADAKPVMAALLAGSTARVEGACDWIAESRLPFAEDGAIGLVATTAPRTGDDRTLVYHPRRIAIGMGCERGADPDEVRALLAACLDEAGIAPAAIACLVSLDVKADETAILAAAEGLGVPARFFDAARLEAETPRLANPSEAVFREVGCHGVAEAAALAAVGSDGALLLPKRKSARATCAVAEAPRPIDAETIGRSRGRLVVIGTGPGDSGWLTPEARHWLLRCDTAIGYGLYLDLVAPLIAHAERIDFPLGAEEARVRRALDLAGEGRSVVLISSGDPGIYAMATLVFECLEQGDLSDGARRAEIVVEPGISAMQALAARAGAPLGHDFCAISLSDLLTPWEAIEKRVRAAAEGDFVTAFYNPVSQRRRTQLHAAKAILAEHRPADTPVMIGRNLGRDGESVTITTLADLDPERIDMLTTIIVGASTTRRIGASPGARVYTPRGYQRKRSAS